MGAQHIRLELVDRNGVVLETSELNFADIVNLIYRSQKIFDESKEKFPLLATIDIYGYTMLNQLQIPLLINDLKKLDLEIQNASLTTKIASSIDFIKKVSNHQFAKFVGD